MKSLISLILNCILFISLGACSVLNVKDNKQEPAKILFKQDVSITVGDKKYQRKAGQTYEFIDPQPILAESNGHLPIFIYPMKDKNNNLNIDLPKLDKSKISKIQTSEINKNLNSILPGIQEVQVMLMKRDFVNALSKIRDLKIKFPKIAYFSFMEGSTYLLMERRAEALKALREGLDIYPNSGQAKELYDRLSKGGL